jgi:hypothetical protein
MDPIGHMSDRHLVHRPAWKEWLKEVPTHLPVQATHTIHRPAPANRQICHFELFRRVVRILAAQSQQILCCYTELLLGITTEVLLDERRQNGRSRRPQPCGGEEIPRSRDSKRDFEGLLGHSHEALCLFQHGEGRMPFVQMTNFRLDAKRTKQSPSANPEEQFLLEAQLRPASIQFAGNPSKLAALLLSNK